jgi:ABC-type glycerol-3-phosphate transport system permease component
MSATASAIAKLRRSDGVKHFIIWVVVLIELFPLYMMLQVSLKDNASFIRNPWVPTPPYSVTETYRDLDGEIVVWTRAAGWSEHFGELDASPDREVLKQERRFDLSVYRVGNWSYGFKLVGPYIANTAFVAVIGTFCSIVFALMGAYFFARYRMPFSGIFWAFFLLLMLMPSVANLVPLFVLLKELSLLNTLWALISVGVAGAQVLNIYVLRNFIEDLPKDLFEAAEMDGAGHWQQMTNVVIPMSGSIIGTLSILAFLGKWNEFLLPLIILRDKELFTLGVGLIYLDGEYVKQWGQIMAAYFIASIPLIVVFMFTMRLFVRGLSAGAVKG